MPLILIGHGTTLVVNLAIRRSHMSMLGLMVSTTKGRNLGSDVTLASLWSQMSFLGNYALVLIIYA